MQKANLMAALRDRLTVSLDSGSTRLETTRRSREPVLSCCKLIWNGRSCSRESRAACARQKLQVFYCYYHCWPGSEYKYVVVARDSSQACRDSWGAERGGIS
jgi:hypothetical protein